MTQKYCEHCFQRMTYSPHSGDFVHTCNSGNPVLDQEDIVKTGQTSTEFGSDVNTGVKPSEVNMQGISNRFWGTRPDVEGHRFGGVTVRGKNKQTHRQRQVYRYYENSEE